MKPDEIGAKLSQDLAKFQKPATRHVFRAREAWFHIPARLCMDLDGSALAMPTGDTLHQA